MFADGNPEGLRLDKKKQYPIVILVRHPQSEANVRMEKASDAHDKMDDFIGKTLTAEMLAEIKELVLFKEKMFELNDKCRDPEVTELGRVQATETIAYLVSEILKMKPKRIRIFDSGAIRTLHLSNMFDEAIRENAEFNDLTIEIRKSTYHGFKEIPAERTYTKPPPAAWRKLLSRLIHKNHGYDVTVVFTHGNFISSVLFELVSERLYTPNCSITAMAIRHETEDIQILSKRSSDHLSEAT